MLSELGQDRCPSNEGEPVRFSVPLLTVAGTVAGTAAAVVAYQAAAASGPAAEPASATPQPTGPAATNWLPCEPGWKIEGTTCVRTRQKVVVVHDLPAQAAAPARSAGVRSELHSSRGEADENEHAGDHDENEVEHGDENEVEHGDENEVEDGEHAEQASDDQPDHEDVGDDD
jgi:hypothetical protein